MGNALRQRLLQDRFDGPAHEAALNLLLAASRLQDETARRFAEFDLTPAQYNVLRILKGAHPGGHPRCDIARRLIVRAPDLTRLIDRLERRGLVERARSDEDRRHSITRITRAGLELLQRMRPAAAALNQALSRRLGPGEIATLSKLCEKLHASD
jgi:DNA-binding MarR family transcriptional regulator